MATRRTRSKLDRLIADAANSGDVRAEQGLQNWARLGEHARRALVAEIVATRSGELRRAYPAIRAVGYGVRTVTPRVHRKANFDEACVAFLVAAKWDRKSKRQRDPAQELPRWLYAYATHRGRRLLCAVPTDVEAAKDYRATPGAAPAGSGELSRGYVLVSDPALGPERGVLTCEVSTPVDAKRYALSCHHVLALSRATKPPGAPALKARVFERLGPAESGREIGQLSVWRGRLLNTDAEYSFDAALAEITDDAAFDSVLGPRALAAANLGRDGLPAEALLVTPDGVLSLRLIKVWTEFAEIRYFRSPPQPLHAKVVEWVVTRGGATQGGYSGSPVVAPDRATLLGMHIAGDERQGAAFMLSVDDLIDFARYDGDGVLRVRA